eukprot:COSAG06_NODE_10052_length_1761_cov_2.098676_1_plen_317_part_10
MTRHLRILLFGTLFVVGTVVMVLRHQPFVDWRMVSARMAWVEGEALNRASSKWIDTTTHNGPARATLTVRGAAVTLILVGSSCATASSTSIPTATFGPDEYVVFVDGPELLAFNPRFNQNCTYVATWTARENGASRVTAYRTRRGYAAVDERAASWPPLHYDLVYNETITIEHGRRECEDPAGSWIALDLASSWRVPVHHLPGRDLGVATSIVLGTNEVMTSYAYVPCYAPRYDPDKPVRSLRNVLFLGDNNMRVVYIDVLHQLQPDSMLPPRANEAAREQQPDVCTQVTGGAWCYRYRPDGQCPHDWDAWDMVVWN